VVLKENLPTPHKNEKVVPKKREEKWILLPP
jgi:hypothetical protein